jgi:hypothetical protein
VKIVLFATLAILLCACSQAAAQGASANRVLIPLAMRNGFPTEYLAATPTPTTGPPPTATRVPPPTATSVPTATPAPAARLEVASSSGRAASLSGYHYVHAKVVNTGAAPAYDPRVSVTYYDAGGAIVGSSTGYPSFRLLRSGEFSTVRTISRPGPTWTRFTVTTSFSTRPGLTYVHDGLDVSGVNSYASGTRVFVVGQVTNRTGQTIRGLSVDVGVYAPDGTIVDSDDVLPFGANDVPTDATASFSAEFFNSDGHIPAGYSYSARAEGYLAP